MGALPKRKISTRRRGRRRQNHRAKLTTVTTCSSCGAVKKTHFKCGKCGR